MNLHENEQLFEDAVIATAQKLKIPEIYIEKDYWITVALYAIFHSTKETDAVFKGGTALAKCHKLINRFSEDIDLAIDKDFFETIIPISNLQLQKNLSR